MEFFQMAHGMFQALSQLAVLLTSHSSDFQHHLEEHDVTMLDKGYIGWEFPCCTPFKNPRTPRGQPRRTLSENQLNYNRQHNAIRCNSHETSFGTILTVIYLFLSKSQINGGKTVWCNERMFAILREKFRQNTKVTSTVSYGFTAPLYALDFSFISLFTYISIS